MQGLSLLFFIAFAFVIGGIYIGIRRNLAKPAVIAAAGILGSIVTMSLSMMARPNIPPAQGLLMGILIGGVMGVITLAAAYYFQRNEMRSQYVQKQEEVAVNHPQ